MKTDYKSKGFTLVEMAIVVIIFGLGLASFGHIVDLYRKDKAATTTTENIADISEYIGAFRELYGRYPCPASMTAQRDDANYGRENCALSGIAAGACNNGICVEQSPRTFAYTDPYTNNPVNQQPRVVVGTLPFRNLNLAEDQAYDGYDHRIVYVVTEHLAFSDTFQPAGGGIDLVDDTGGSALEDASTAHFLVFSHGENGEGAYTIDGVQSPCATGAAESENCTISTNAIYSLKETSTKDDASHFDDVMAFFTQKDLPTWQMSEEGGHETDAHVKNPGNVGFGVADVTDVDEELKVGNVLRVQDNPDTTSNTEGKIQSQKICDFVGDPSGCFSSSLIGGQIAAGEGLSCPSGQYMKGIANSAPICATEITKTCPTGYYMTGIDASGELICNVRPPAGCPSTDVTLVCEDGTTTYPRTLPARRNGEQFTIRAGHSRARVYECRNGTWTALGAATGICNCTPDTSRPIDSTASCASWSDCGDRFTGTRDTQWQFVCPAATWNNVEIGRDRCVCAETRRTTTWGCPVTYSGGREYKFNSGRIYGENVHICTGTPRCSGWREYDRDCKCTADYKDENRACTGGYSGTYKVEKFFKCDSGPTSPGYWTDWSEKPGFTIAEKCSCVAKDLPDTESACPVGYEGKVITKSKIVCDGGVPRTETSTVSSCKLIEPERCTWKDMGTSTGSGKSPLRNQSGTSCECGVDKPGACSKPAGGTNHDYYLCICGS